MNLTIVLTTLIRQGITSLAAILVSSGILGAEALPGFVDSTTELVVGVVLFVGAYVWSLVSKKKALDTPVPKVGK